jgi:hypothetical protein
VRQPRLDEISNLRKAAIDAIGFPLASPEVIARVLSHDPETIWIFDSMKLITGGFAFLYLNTLGVERLRSGELNLYDPDLNCLAAPNELPAGCYWWVGFRIPGQPHGIDRVLEFMRGPRFRAADFWMTPFTNDGRAFAVKMGFQPVHDAVAPGLYRYVRKVSRPVVQEA